MCNGCIKDRKELLDYAASIARAGGTPDPEIEEKLREITYRHSKFKKPRPTLDREHGTLRGCRQHWTRGEELCDVCEEFHELEQMIRENKKKKLQEKRRVERSLPATPQETMPTSVRLSKSSLDGLGRMARETGISRNALIQRAIDAFLVM